MTPNLQLISDYSNIPDGLSCDKCNKPATWQVKSFKGYDLIAEGFCDEHMI